jgi:four helix bundle protein
LEERTDEKHQTPKTKEPTTYNLQKHRAGVGLEKEGWRVEPLLLRDEPPERNVPRHPFDLEERTAVFGESIVRFSKTIPRNPSNNRLIDQVVGAGTSVGANFCEANDCFSKKDFRFIVERCIKEAKETRFFLRMIAASELSLADEARILYREATELLKILATMYRK